MLPYPGLSSDGGELLCALIGLHLILPPPGGQVECRHHGHHLLQACGCQGHGDGRSRCQSQTHGPTSHCDRLLDAGELHRASLSHHRVQWGRVFFRQVLSVIQLCLSQRLQKSLGKLNVIYNDKVFFYLIKSRKEVGLKEVATQF